MQCYILSVLVWLRCFCCVATCAIGCCAVSVQACEAEFEFLKKAALAEFRYLEEEPEQWSKY